MTLSQGIVLQIRPHRHVCPHCQEEYLHTPEMRAPVEDCVPPIQGVLTLRECTECRLGLRK